MLAHFPRLSLAVICFMSKYRKIFLSAILVIAAISTFIYFQNSHEMLSENFISKWTKIFSEIQSPSDFQKIAKSDRPDLIVLRKFKDGTWIAGVCNGSIQHDWSASVYIDSSLRQYKSLVLVSGYEALHGLIYEVKAKSLSDFLQEFRLEIHEIKRGGI